MTTPLTTECSNGTRLKNTLSFYSVFERGISEQKMLQELTNLVSRNLLNGGVTNDLKQSFLMHSPQNLLQIIAQMQEALQANGVFHTQLECQKRGGKWDEYQLDAINRTRDALAAADSLQFQNDLSCSDETEPLWSWEKRNGIAFLHEGFREPIPYNEPSLREALSNIQRHKHLYVTEEAWLLQLRIFSEGLACFEFPEKNS